MQSLQNYGEAECSMEQILPLDTKAKCSHIRLRLDGGFGTEENINYALWRGYHLLAKISASFRQPRQGIGGDSPGMG